MRILVILLLLIPIVSCSDSPKISEPPIFSSSTVDLVSGETAEWVDCIDYGDIVMGSAVGFAGSKPDQYRYFEHLTKTASPDELFALIKHQNPSVRVYAFEGLVSAADPRSFEAFTLLSRDTTAVSTMFGCIMSSEPVPELVFQTIQMGRTYTTSYEPTPTEDYTLDSLAFIGMVSGRPRPPISPWPAFYPEIKAKVTQEKDLRFLSVFAAYQNEADIDFILTLLDAEKTRDYEYYEAALQAIFEYPHPAFLPLLKEWQQQMLTEKENIPHIDPTEFYLAVFRYPPAVIVAFLEGIPVDESIPSHLKESHLNGVEVARRLNKNPAKKALAKSLELDELDQMMLSHLQQYRKFSDLH